MILSLDTLLLCFVVWFAIHALLDAFLLVAARQEGWVLKVFRIFTFLFSLLALFSSYHHYRAL